MSRFACRNLAAVVLALCRALTLHAGEMKGEIDCGANGKLLSTYFRRFPAGSKAVEFEREGVRFWASAETKKPERISLYSTFVVAGDFEICATFQWTPVVVPKDGYGASCGIAVEADSVSVSLARGNFPGDGSAFVVTKGSLAGEKKKYDNDYFPTDAKSGKLVLRREKNDLVCLIADGAGELREVCPRFPFSAETVRKVIFFADPGGAATSMDVRLSRIRVRGEEISTTLPKSEAGGWMRWWLTAGALAAASVLVVLVVRRMRQRES